MLLIRRLSLYVLLLFIPFVLKAQPESSGRQYEINTLIHDFGIVYDNQGKLSCSFEIKNTGTHPLFIVDIKKACGCMEVKFSNKEIRPGETGSIRVWYANNEGSHQFDKTLTVTLAAETKPLILHIKGNVVRGPINPTKDYVYKIGKSLLISDKEYSAGILHPFEQHGNMLWFYNSSRKSIEVAITSSNELIELQRTSFIIPGKTLDSLAFKLTANSSTYGKRLDTLFIYVKKPGRIKKYRNGLCTISHIVVPHPSKLNPGPKVVPSTNRISLGPVKRSLPIQKTFSITNKGVSPLNLFSITCSPSIDVSLNPTTLLPDETLELTATITFNQRHSQEKNVGLITIYSDSSPNPVETIYVTYQVKLTFKERLENLLRWFKRFK